MTRRVISVEYQIPGFSKDYYEYGSDQSLLDADVVVFKPEKFYSPSDGGKPSYDDGKSFAIQKSAKHWQAELSVALEYGKTVFLLLAKYQLRLSKLGEKKSKDERR